MTRRDLAVPVLLGLLGLAVLPATGMDPTGWLPRTPRAFLWTALLLTAFFAAGVAPSIERGARSLRSLRPLAIVLAAGPFIAFGLIEIPSVRGTIALPALGWLAVAAVAPALCASRRATRWGGIVLVVLLGADAVLGASGLRLLPSGWNPATTPAAAIGPATVSARSTSSIAADGPAGLRVGAAVAVEDVGPLSEGAGPWFVPAVRATLPPVRPVVLLMDGATDALRVEPDVGVFVPPDAVGAWTSSLQLDVFDAAVILPGAWLPGASEADRRADLLTAYVRRGGLLVGPAPGRPWPRPLGRRLGSAGQAGRTGFDGARSLGLGSVVRAASDTEIRRVLRERAGRPRLSTVFDAATIPPPAPPGLEPWTDDPSSRRGQGLLLIVYAIVAAALDLVSRRGAGRLLGLLAPACALTVGLVWTSPADPGVRVDGVVLDLGGGGGRRVEAVLLSAGPAGWSGDVRWRGGGLVRLLGGSLTEDGRVQVAPRRRAWVLRESAGRGALGSDLRSDGPDHLASLLRGPLERRRLGYGRLLSLPVSVEGCGSVGAATLTVR